jgi:hypothetical protein
MKGFTMPRTTPTIQYPANIDDWVEKTWNALLEETRPWTERERVFYVVCNLFFEVQNGGIAQYYDNPSGEDAGEAVSALRAIGATACADLVAACNKKLGREVPRDQEQRGAALDQLPNTADAAFEAAEQEIGQIKLNYYLLYWFYTTGEATSLDALRTSHPELFSDERFLAAVASKPHDQQFAFWLAALEDLIMSSDEKTLPNTEITAYDIAERLAHLEHFDLQPVLTVVAKRIAAPQFNEKGSSEWQKRGALSRASHLVHAALDLIAARARPEAQLEKQLQAWLVELQRASAQQTLVGLHAVVIGRVMHRLWPRRYPEAELGHHDNKLLNAAAFLPKTN